MTEICIKCAGEIEPEYRLVCIQGGLCTNDPLERHFHKCGEVADIGKELRQLRFDRGMFLSDMAEYFGITPAQLSYIETGRDSIPSGFVDKLDILNDSSMEETEEQKENDKILKQIYDQHNMAGVIKLLDNPYNEDKFFVTLELFTDGPDGLSIGAECYIYKLINDKVRKVGTFLTLTLYWDGSFHIAFSGTITSQSHFKIFNERVHTIVYEMGAEMFREKFKLADSVFKGEV